MTQVQGIPYRRHGPSAALREFLDPLDPGDYFDCGRARLHGLDDALLDEARSRGRTIGDDAFLLVATDMGLIFCRPSISFAIAARWEDIGLIRPRGDDPVVLPVTWPRHGELKFTLSKRLAGNIFRRWLQLRMHVARRVRQAEQHPLSVPSGLDLGRATVADPPPEVDARDDHLDRMTETETAADAEFEFASDGAVVHADAGFATDFADAGPDVDAATDVGAAAAAADVDAAIGSYADADPGSDPNGFDGVETVEPPTSRPASTGDDLPFLERLEPLTARTGPETLVDEDLERVSVPRSSTLPPSWVGSAVSLAASLVVISTVVLIATVSVSLWRGASGGSSTSADVAGPETEIIDHERFRATADPVGQLAQDGGTDTTDLAPSAAGGASQALPSSSQQLLAMTPDTTDLDGARRCSSNYSGCVPDVTGTTGADVDCVGQGDGPYFAETEVMVLGDDVYGLDSDGDRLACEADQLPADPLTPGSSGDGS